MIIKFSGGSLPVDQLIYSAVENIFILFKVWTIDYDPMCNAAQDGFDVSSVAGLAGQTLSAVVKW